MRHVIIKAPIILQNQNLWSNQNKVYYPVAPAVQAVAAEKNLELLLSQSCVASSAWVNFHKKWFWFSKKKEEDEKKRNCTEILL